MGKSIDDSSRGARLARRDEGAYSRYVPEEQRSQPGWLGREGDRLTRTGALAMHKLERRRLLSWCALLGAAGAGCHHEVTCPPTTLSPEDAKCRLTLQYTDHSPNPDKACRDCQQYLAKGRDECGGCKLLKGPVNPSGYCAAFSAKG